MANTGYKVIIDSETVESFMQEGKTSELLALAKHYKEKSVLEDMLGFRYCLSRCNLFHALIKYCEVETISALFDYVISVMGKEYFTTEINKNLDGYARNALIIAAKHKDMELVLTLLNKYNLDPNYYCRHNRMSAFSYILKRKKFKYALSCLEKMDPTVLNDSQREWFKEDLLQLRSNISDEELVEQHWLKALTMKYTGKARISKLNKSLFMERTSFGSHRLRQLMRHISLQLYVRWKLFPEVETLDDVQIMYVEKIADKKNPYPRPCLFIACTPVYSAESFIKDFKTKSFKDKLLADYDVEDGIGQVRSNRFRQKLQDRVWGKDHEKKTTKESKKLGELLKTDYLRTQKIIKVRNGIKMPFFEYQERTAYLIFTDGYTRKGMHAEEVLCDVAKHMKKDFDCKTYIYGKTRPCVSCTGRMTLTNLDGFNKHPGFLWLSTMEQQEVEAAKQSLTVLFDTSSYITYFSQEMMETPAYDTASDSE